MELQDSAIRMLKIIEVVKQRIKNMKNEWNVIGQVSMITNDYYKLNGWVTQKIRSS